MKKAILTILLLLSALIGFSQINFYKFAVGAGFGTNISYADVRENSQGYSGHITADYNLTPFLTAGLEFQAGQIRGGNVITNPHNRQFKNNYKGFSLNGRVALGQFVGYYRQSFLSAIKGLYVGVGLGAISNKMSYIVRYKPNTQATNPPLGYLFPGKDKSVNLLMPLNLGMNFYFKDRDDQLRYIVNINYQGNLTFGEGLDGYNDPMVKFENDAPDMYTVFSVGVKYNFGPVGISKRIFEIN
ncbi:hypothetical protein [Pedobacter frigiditerrae]|uniref:hypothetical protein n=1 Tax=Pedobacter frigiditerrae TaxID=2530452 RepID=UPI002930DA1F|nr:hypothetical protein [Pedobacter frigiditerrae]